MYPDQINAEVNQCNTYSQGIAGAGASVKSAIPEWQLKEAQGQAYEPSHAAQAEKRAAHHFAEGRKAEQAAAFFRSHPEFEEFIKLIRSGAVQI